jgi:LacI family transcriptional regulator
MRRAARVTRIGDVARVAGVSPATVSRALNGITSVDPELAKRALEAADKLGYRRNGLGRSLRRQRTDVIALIISDVENPFFTAVARGAEDAAQREGFSVLLCNADEDPDKERRYLEVAEQERASGVILSPNHRTKDIGRLSESGLPVCIIDRQIGGTWDTVRADSRDAARAATAHLLERGWRRPACITGPETARTAVERLAGYRQALQDHHVRPASTLVRHADFRRERAREACASLLDERRPPDSLFVANSSMALGVLAELTERKLRPGRDVGVVAIDDPAWTSFTNPPLTVVSQPAYDIGRRSVELLLERVNGTYTGRARDVVLPTTLLVRGSSRAPRGAAKS